VGGGFRAAGMAREPARAVLIGGYHGTWVDAGRVASTRLDRDSLAAAGLRMGSGVVVVLPQAACPVAEASRVMMWLAGQTAGQCGPCVHGLRAIAGQFEAVRRGRSDRLGLARLRRWSDQVDGRGACHHPDGSVDFLRSSLDVFEPELEMHRRFGPCEYCEALPILRAPLQGRLAA
jgi:NADH:ubiquinone oxidoreductase subunit F (NADH-binding)